MMTRTVTQSLRLFAAPDVALPESEPPIRAERQPSHPQFRACGDDEHCQDGDHNPLVSTNRVDRDLPCGTSGHEHGVRQQWILPLLTSPSQAFTGSLNPALSCVEHGPGMEHVGFRRLGP
jgi:hypothetical protein